MGRRFSTEVVFTLQNQPSWVRFLSQLVKIESIKNIFLEEHAIQKFVGCQRTQERLLLKILKYYSFTASFSLIVAELSLIEITEFKYAPNEEVGLVWICLTDELERW